MEIEKREFKLKSKFKPTGDQPAAIAGLIDGMKAGKNMQTLLGVTGSGKTFTMANVIAKIGKPTLILAHNKTLAAQLYEEMREFFPENRVEYFISYYDYYQPESYLPAKDQYIEKDSAINPRIEMMRHATVASLLTRRDVIVVASVSCIYGMSDPKMFRSMGFAIEVGKGVGGLGGRRGMIQRLVNSAFERNDLDLIQGRFRVKGDTIDFIPGYSENVIRVEFFGDEVERIFEIDKVTGERVAEMKYFHVWPARNYVVPEEVFDRAVGEIRDQLKMDLMGIDDELVKHRLKQRTLFDLEMIKETGTCKGIENYSRHFDGRKEGEQAFCLLDYFPKNDFLFIIDESHRSVPQVGGMFNGDRARKKNLIDYGFRLTSAFDNRPLKFGEFEKYLKGNSTVFVSATPGDYEGENSEEVVEQIIRPTGLVDPVVEIRGISPKKPSILLAHGLGKTSDESWLKWFKKKYENDYNVIAPDFPNPDNPKLDKWLFEIEKHKDLLDENSILIGQSLGAPTVCKFLEKNKINIGKLILVAPAPCKYDKKDFDIINSKLTGNAFDAAKKYVDELDLDLSKAKKHAKESVIFFSKDDPYTCDFKKRLEQYSRLKAKVVLFEDKGHFNESNGVLELPEIDEYLGDNDGQDLKDSYGGQVRDCLVEIDRAVKKGSRVLLTTLTKRMAEELTDFLALNGHDSGEPGAKRFKVRYMHSEIDTFERTEILRELRLGKFDVLVGINLLREGIDVPEIGFVGVLDADKEGFLRDARSLIQIIGRAARNSEARVVLYADNITGSIKKAMDETARRRKIQIEYNRKNNITPKTIVKPIKEKQVEIKDVKSIPKAEIKNVVIELEADMKEAAELLDFERAMYLRDRVRELGKRLGK